MVQSQLMLILAHGTVPDTQRGGGGGGGGGDRREREIKIEEGWERKGENGHSTKVYSFSHTLNN